MSLSFGYGSVLADTVTLNNFSSTTVVYESDKVQQGKTVILRDLGVIFTTTGGTVHFAIRTISGGLVRISSSVTANDENLAYAVLNEGESIALVITVDGNGVVTILGHGEIKEAVKPSFFETPKGTNLFRRGGF